MKNRNGAPARRSGEAMAALGRRAPVMRHRLAARGGARNEQLDLMEVTLQEHGLDQPYQDSDTLVEACSDGCTHTTEADCMIALPDTACGCPDCLDFETLEEIKVQSDSWYGYEDDEP